MNILEERTPAQIDLDNRICSHISRGSRQAYQIISTYHMSEVAQIRNYMMDILRSEYFNDARALNSAFRMAVAELHIDLGMLLKEGTVIISTNKQVARLAV